MTDILEKYHYPKPNKIGFICCPFHGEKTASMKIHQNYYYCFGCGETGDIFTFVQRALNLSFKEAFLELGGSYEDKTNSESFSAKLKKYHTQKMQSMKKNKAAQLQKDRDLNNLLIDIYRKNLEILQPLTEDWGYLYNALQYQLYIHEELNNLR